MFALVLGLCEEHEMNWGVQRLSASAATALPRSRYSRELEVSPAGLCRTEGAQKPLKSPNFP